MIDYRLPEMPRTITRETMAIFLCELRAIGLLYHIDDDPRAIGFYGADGLWHPTFSDSEAYALIGFFQSATGVNGKGPLTWDDIWDLVPLEGI